jgi:hypothetical protein
MGKQTHAWLAESARHQDLRGFVRRAVVLVSFEPFHGDIVTLAAAALVAAAYYAVFRERG